MAQLVQERDLDDAEGLSGRRVRGRRWSHPFTIIRRIFGNAVFSSLTRRILFFNLAALLVLVGGILYLNQFREGLIDARVESLLTQGEIIAGAVSASASVDTNSITIDPQKLLELQAGQSITPVPNDEDLEFPIDPEKVAPVLRRLISPTRTRARIFDADANLLLDSRHLYSRGQVLRFDLPPVVEEEKQTWAEWLTTLFNKALQPGNLPVYKEAPGGDGSIYPEVMNALTGVRGAVVRTTDKGALIVSVAVPIQRFRAVLGVLLLSTQAGDIDNIVHAERLAIMRVFGVATLVNVLLSLVLSSTIANPLRRLSAAAIRVRRGAKEREEIPDFSARQDEIGNLSIALREMTTALYDRIDAIESFAADVSHELKNPLTSLRSAVETLPLAKSDDSKKRLMDVIQHDVRRLDRLISDISDASRLDAELARVDARSVDLELFLSDLVEVSRQIRHKNKEVQIELAIERKPGVKTRFVVNGHDLRIGQIITNLIENARSFVPDEGGKITVRLFRTRSRCIVYIEDNGPGIQAENIDRIFERFYTDRPESEGFGQNSGLGLSISRQIAEAHGGSLRAENIIDAETAQVLGARFILALPAVSVSS
ncbi:two-component system, OmpR family, sensor histidine kinase ChvG [Rhizobium mongolense subsp. loessense]|uniref:histidine kinase n=1 Tax=Rhizobium mongolense subsp. loessense TaxID=158890 RepID=A0A1G4SKK4_9HYPH|nr:sensor histidine kinase [Rhizobium mongolense]SCW69752.1 two-component system, OmpR family, sensor histidine kinase ChvG [Rhizobium mongolense subsp. loessense]